MKEKLLENRVEIDGFNKRSVVFYNIHFVIFRAWNLLVCINKYVPISEILIWVDVTWKFWNVVQKISDRCQLNLKTHTEITLKRCLVFKFSIPNPDYKNTRLQLA